VSGGHASVLHSPPAHHQPLNPGLSGGLAASSASLIGGFGARPVRQFSTKRARNMGFFRYCPATYPSCYPPWGRSGAIRASPWVRIKPAGNLGRWLLRLTSPQSAGYDSTRTSPPPSPLASSLGRALDAALCSMIRPHRVTLEDAIRREALQVIMRSGVTTLFRRC
jgi:hypothetical protein